MRLLRPAKDMQIKLAKHIGFCFGVKRAVNIAVHTLAGKKNTVYASGPIIHNPQTVQSLRAKGLKIVKDINRIKRGTLIVCSHGMGPRILQRAKKRQLDIIDATCPFVKKVQDIARDLKRNGYHVILVGDKNHPEIKAIKEIVGRDITIIEDVHSVIKMKSRSKKIGIIAQTTQRRDNYYRIIEHILKTIFWGINEGFNKITLSEVRIFDTICNATLLRQQAAKALTKEVDLIFVIGGKMSANTTRLAQICCMSGVRTYHIERAEEIKESWLKGVKKIGIASGTSTPKQIINAVVEKLKNNNF
ncbi:MAG: 4-hydroxy-3-methylbut-2-enyl diphosphate reductase [Candidatus Omnitrophota bacterium]